jgi:hypothetical protein
VGEAEFRSLAVKVGFLANPIPECRAEPVNRDVRVEASAELMQAAVRQPQAALGLEYRIALVGFLFASDIIQEGDGGAAERHNVFPLPFGVRCGNPPNIADLAVIVEHLRPGGIASLTTAARRQDDERQTERVDARIVHGAQRLQKVGNLRERQRWMIAALRQGKLMFEIVSPCSWIRTVSIAPPNGVADDLC